MENLIEELKDLIKNWKESGEHAEEPEGGIFVLCANELEFVLNRKKS